MKNTKKQMGWKSLALATVMAFSVNSFYAYAESAADKMEDVKTDTKKNTRKVKRKIRNATGNGSVTKDMGDAAKDVKDETKGAVNKVTN